MNQIVNTRWQDGVKELKPESFDLIFFDPPDGRLKEKWDEPFLISDLWKLIYLIPNTGSIVIWGTDKSNAELQHEWSSYFKYKWYWRKTRKNGYFWPDKKPMSEIEEICVFSGAKQKYNYSAESNLLEFPSSKTLGKIHPCQKPLDLCQYIVKAYTDPGDNVLDICFGSGSILQAAKTTGRNYFGFESDPKFFIDAKHRLENKNI